MLIVTRKKRQQIVINLRETTPAMCSLADAVRAGNQTVEIMAQLAGLGQSIKRLSIKQHYRLTEKRCWFAIDVPEALGVKWSRLPPLTRTYPLDPPLPSSPLNRRLELDETIVLVPYEHWSPADLARQFILNPIVLTVLDIKPPICVVSLFLPSCLKII